MRKMAIAPLAAIMALAACNSSDDAETAAADGGERVVAQPGMYTAQVELVDFQVEGVDDATAQQMRDSFTQAVAAGHSYCLTATEAEQSGEELARKLADGNCTMDSFDYSGSVLDADMTCTIGQGDQASQGKVTIDGEIQETASTMTMAMEQVIPGAEGDLDVDMTMRMTSQRTGDCAVEDAA